MKPWSCAFILSLATAMFWGIVARVAGCPLWAIIVTAVIAFLASWFAYGLCAGGAITPGVRPKGREEPKL